MKKREINRKYLVAATLVLLLIFIFISSPQPFYTNNFENTDLSYWNTLVVGDDNFFGVRHDTSYNSALFMRSPRDDVSAAFGTLQTQHELTGDYDISLRFRLSTDNFDALDFHWIYILRSRDINLVADQPRFEQGKPYMTVICRSGGVNQLVGKIEFDRWYDFTIIANSEHRTYDIYIDGTFAGTCKMQENIGKPNNYFGFGDDERGLPGQGLNSGQAWWDDLTIAEGAKKP
jgi:hypothetical protein